MTDSLGCRDTAIYVMNDPSLAGSEYNYRSYRMCWMS